MLQIEKKAETIPIKRILKRTSAYTDDVLRYIKGEMDDGHVKLKPKKVVKKKTDYNSMVNNSIIKMGKIILEVGQNARR